MTTTTSGHGTIGNIPADYRHTAKKIFPGDDLALTGGRLKWYDVHVADQPTPDTIREQARTFLAEEAESGRLELRGELGYALLHLDGDGYFLIVVVWRNTNELWQTLYGHGPDGFAPYPAKPGALRPTQNIFELDATAHERRAWSRYLSSDRSEAAKHAYLDDRCTGELI